MQADSTSIEDTNSRTVLDLFKLRQDGQIAELMKLLSDDIEFRCNAPISVLPFAGERKGREAVLEYFAALEKDWTMESYDVQEVIAQGDRVVALSNICFRNNKTGKLLESRKADVIRVREGQVVAFEEFFDSAASDQASQ